MPSASARHGGVQYARGESIRGDRDPGVRARAGVVMVRLLAVRSRSHRSGRGDGATDGQGRGMTRLG